jgi:hypothetical protein
MLFYLGFGADQREAVGFAPGLVCSSATSDDRFRYALKTHSSHPA